MAFYALAIVVREGEAVMVTRFGRPLRIAETPGLHWKLPWPIDQASLLDMRRRSLESLDKLVNGNTSLLLRTDSEPFSLLQSKDGK